MAKINNNSLNLSNKKYIEVVVVGVDSNNQALVYLVYYLPLLCKISDGFKIIICTLLAAGMGAVLFPIREEES